MFPLSIASGRRVITYDIINDVLVGFKRVQYTNVPVAITGLPSPSISVTRWKWEIRNSSTNALIDLSFDQNPSFTITAQGYYNIILTATNNTDSWIKKYEHAFRVLAPRFIEAECDVVIDVSIAGYFHNFQGTTNPNFKIGLKGTGTAAINPFGLQGTAGNPARIQVLGNSDVNITCPSGVPHCLRFDGDVKYMVIDGSKDDGSIGLKITSTLASNSQTVMFRDFFTNVEVLKVKVTGAMVAKGAAFSMVTAPSATCNATNYAHNDCAILYCEAYNGGQEMIYAGYNNDSPVGGYQPPKHVNPIFAWNYCTNMARDGIQPGSCCNVNVHNNILDSCGREQTEANQDSGVSWNGGTYGICYGNIITNTNMFFNIQSGQSPWNVFASETTPHDSYFFDNVYIKGSGYTINYPQAFAIYAQITNGTGAGAGHLNYHLWGNTAITDVKWMEQYYGTSCFTSDKYTCVNNIIVKVGNAGTTPELNFAGPGTKPTGGQYLINNLVRNLGSEADILFNNEAGNDLSISSFSSPAYAGGSTDIAARFPELSNYLYDYLGFPLLVGANPYTFGAYSGYQNWTVAPVTGDPNPASFTTPVTMTSITQGGGTLGYEANKIGLLYYIFSLVDVAPTITQIRAGQLASGSHAPVFGSLIDSGTVTPKVITGGTENTNYYLFCVFVTLDNVEQAAVTRVAFTTIADTTAPILTNWRITDANKNRITFDSSEPITATTFAHFTVASISKTISSLTINTGATIGHYFTVTVPYEVDDASTISYAGGDNFQDTASVPNLLASFGAVVISNNIIPAPEEDWTVGQNSNITFAADTVNQNGSNSGGMRTGKKIPSGSAGYIKFDWDTALIESNSNTECRPGIILGTTTFTYLASQLIFSWDFIANGNTSVWEGNNYRTTRGGMQAPGNIFMCRRDKNNVVTAEWSINGGASYTVLYTFGTYTGDIYGAVEFTNGPLTNRKVVNVKIQANKGLI